jgi:hypothetical protein
VKEWPSELKEIFRQQAVVRRDRQIKRGILQISMEEMAIYAFNELWSSWVSVLGKEGATDCLIEAMIEEHELIRARILYQTNWSKMIEHQKDKARTKELWQQKVFQSRYSYVSISGHMYLSGVDVSYLRDRVFADEDKCAICGKKLALGQGDLEHEKGGRGPQRCDCYHTTLADGTVHTNVRRTHSMWDVENCHRLKHHRV